tara:strand:- start:1621 stop:1899 length:279 start_codon:yes stop_codon:yes gene_type:complete
MYRPLPKELTIKNSGIDGQGVFASEDVIAGHYFGITHHYSGNLIRTPLGGFLNHSDSPNCFIKDNETEGLLFTVRPIHEGEELTVYYRKYDV